VQPGSVPVDAAGVADDQDGEEPDDEDEEEPGRITIAQLARERRPQQARGNDGDGHGPTGLAEADLMLRLCLLRLRGHCAIFAHGEAGGV
jgi:hypothetical protein